MYLLKNSGIVERIERIVGRGAISCEREIIKRLNLKMNGAKRSKKILLLFRRKTFLFPGGGQEDYCLPPLYATAI